MNNIPNDVLAEIIKNKVKLFTKESYFYQFSRILLELYNNISAFQKLTSLSFRMKTKLKAKYNTSYWQIIADLIFPSKIQINVDNIFEKEYNLDTICFQYLKNLCYIKMKKLTNLSMVEQVDSNRVIPLYLKLCEKEIKLKIEREIVRRGRKVTFLNKNTTIRKTSMMISRQNSMVNRGQLKINISKVGNKNGPSIQPLEYTNSFTRLFIGETDEKSIRERYLSNMVVKKHKQLHLANSYGDISINYLKRMYKKLFKNEGEKGAIDNDMMNIINQFENDHKRIDNYQRNLIINEKTPHYMLDYNQQNILFLELNKQKEKYKKNKRNKRNRNIILRNKFTNNKENKSLFISNEVSKNNNQEIGQYTKYSINKKQLNFIHYKKLNECSIFNKRILNSRASNVKLSLTRLNPSFTKKRINKNGSSFISSIKNKNNTSTFLVRPKSYIKNYMNKNDFFFFG